MALRRYGPQKSIYKPIHPEKYVGQLVRGEHVIVCRSGWERTFCKQLDLNPNVLKWSSEEVIVPYRDPLNGRKRRYFPDFLVKINDKNDKIKTIMIEIKPFTQTQKPKPRKTDKYLKEEYTYAVNKAKWKAAELMCEAKGWTFLVVTEKDVKFFK